MLENIYRLDGKVIVITGATGLLGRKHAEAIACYGGTPILLDLCCWLKAIQCLGIKVRRSYRSFF